MLAFPSTTVCNRYTSADGWIPLDLYMGELSLK